MPVSDDAPPLPPGKIDHPQNDMEDDGDGAIVEMVDEVVVDRETGSAYHRVLSTLQSEIETSILPEGVARGTKATRKRRGDVVLADVPHMCDDLPDNPHRVCWWDSHPFEGQCVFIPGTYDLKRKRFVQWEGVFCSWECALAYAHHTNNHRSVPMIWQLRQAALGRMGSLQRALHFSELHLYGGSLTVEEFRKARV